ncbi:MAG: hypothetical protein U5K70_06015 [Halodesulfurarchaeum sp.]|nr:hypothetical protein [Halodesulfurarchaeum sp.]
MNRFAGTTAEERAALIVAAIRAHRDRQSPYLTLEVDPESDPKRSGGATVGPPPWIQYREQDERLNLDCTADELDSMRAAIDQIGGVRVTEQESVEGGGTNLRISVSGDDERVAHVMEQILVDGFGLPADHRLWAIEI